MRISETDGCKQLYTGTSLQSFLSIKRTLESNDIKFIDKTKSNDSWFRFFVQIFAIGTGSYGMNREHEINYHIYVKHNDFNKALNLVKDYL